jgi:hypothetical protein
MAECSLQEKNGQGAALLAGGLYNGQKMSSREDPQTGLIISNSTDNSTCGITDANRNGVAAYGEPGTCRVGDPVVKDGSVTVTVGAKDSQGNGYAVCVKTNPDGTKVVQGAFYDAKSGEKSHSTPEVFGPAESVNNRNSGLDDFYRGKGYSDTPVRVQFRDRTSKSESDQPQKNPSPTTQPQSTPPTPEEEPPPAPSTQPEKQPEATQPQEPKAPPVSKPSEDPKLPPRPSDSRDRPESGETAPQPESPTQSDPSPELQPTPGTGSPGPGGGPSLDDVISVLDVLGFFPGPVGYAAQAGLAGIYAYQGKYQDALVAGIGAIPIAGALSKLRTAGTVAGRIQKASKLQNKTSKVRTGLTASKTYAKNYPKAIQPKTNTYKPNAERYQLDRKAPGHVNVKLAKNFVKQNRKDSGTSQGEPGHAEKGRNMLTQAKNMFREGLLTKKEYRAIREALSSKD